MIVITPPMPHSKHHVEKRQPVWLVLHVLGTHSCFSTLIHDVFTGAKETD